MAKQPAFSEDHSLSSNALDATAIRQRRVVLSAELESLQFKMPPNFVRSYKQEALNRGEKLNEFLNTLFQHFLKTGKTDG